MKHALWGSVLGLILFVVFTNCAHQFSPSTQNSDLANNLNTPLPATGSEKNVLPVTVGCGYLNEPCVSVTICSPGTANCQTINNILLDTGSFGLRIFSSLVNVNLSQEVDSQGHSIAECNGYVNFPSDWGPIKLADIQLGGEKASSVPIQIIQPTFATPPSSCKNLAADPPNQGYNGVLGLGLFREDCGPGCTTTANNNVYFLCSGNTCTSSTVQLNQQVTNPVALMPTDNNGIALQLDSVPISGQLTSTGFLVLGIGTQSDNLPPSGVQEFPADGYGNFQTQFNSKTYTTAFIDSGSNTLAFPATSSLPDCGGANTGFFCPSSLLTLSAVVIGASGASQAAVSFQVMNATNALNPTNPNLVFPDLAASMSSDFDWGLPFFLGRTIYVGLENQKSKLGTGPYWGF